MQRYKFEIEFETRLPDVEKIIYNMRDCVEIYLSNMDAKNIKPTITTIKDDNICWNCLNFDSFGGICLYHGNARNIDDSCDKFGVDQTQEIIQNLKLEVLALTELNHKLQKDSDELQALKNNETSYGCDFDHMLNSVLLGSRSEGEDD